MGASVRDNKDDDLDAMHEINVTPFIDVMLVLLIIFMVAAPLPTVDVEVDLPASTAQPQERPDDPLYLTLQQDLSLSLGEAPLARGELAAALDASTRGDRRTRIFLRADQAVPYGELMGVMNLLRDAGYLSVALVGLDASTGAQRAPAPDARQTGGSGAPIDGRAGGVGLPSPPAGSAAGQSRAHSPGASGAEADP